MLCNCFVAKDTIAVSILPILFWMARVRAIGVHLAHHIHRTRHYFSLPFIKAFFFGAIFIGQSLCWFV